MSTVRIPSRQRRWPAYIIGAVIVLAVLFTVMSQFYVDLLWFREVGFTSVFWAEIRTKLLLGAIFALLFFALLVRQPADRATYRADHPVPHARPRGHRAHPAGIRAASAVVVARWAARCWRSWWASASPASGRRSCCGGTRAASSSATPSRCSGGIRPSTSSRCRGSGSCRGGCSPRSSASRC